MGRIVTVNVVDLTRPIEQKGFKSFALVEFGTSETYSGFGVQTVTSTAELPITASESLKASASSFFGNGGQTLIVAGKKIETENEAIPFLEEVLGEAEFYGLGVIMEKSFQSGWMKKIKEFAEGNKKLSVIEANGTVEEVKEAVAGLNSDRVVVFAHSNEKHQGIASAVAGICFPQDEGSITWGNKAVTGVATSGYNLTDEAKLLDENVNYITKEKGLVITQFGRTLSGSNADITRSKDWLENRCAESLTSTLINNKKVPFTVQGMAMISSSLNQVGVQAVSMGMLDSFNVITPSVKDIPTNDKANRVLRGVKFIAVLSGAIETIEMELQVKL